MFKNLCFVILFVSIGWGDCIGGSERFVSIRGRFQGGRYIFVCYRSLHTANLQIPMALPQQPTTLGSGLESQPLVATVSGNVQKYAMKKKKVLNAEETDLFELTQAAGIAMDQEVFKIIVDLLKMNVAPLAVFQMLKAMCAGQRIADTSTGESSSTGIQNATSESRARNKPSPVVCGSQVPAERSGRDGSSQRAPRQPSASRLHKSGKSTGSSGLQHSSS
ncbi:mitotic-spindle organizing protein 2 isoform X4 [Polyodon spathula]|uniref:mitotic-spindle organizing protein 2 isoform X4 n=1 Tax=Polyodon spathula TaxID=7913 RepID=UPI001B7E4AED|nr:mitotic-spindle organizing protein 2 isoform X4 [Polyodon spathula]